MLNRKRIVLGMVLVTLVFLGIFTVVQAQNRVISQQWQYAIVMWNPSDNTYTYRTSSLYEGNDTFEPAISNDLTQQVWDGISQVEGVGLVDYLGVMGLSGYELVDVTNVQTALMIYTFKRPAKQ